MRWRIAESPEMRNGRLEETRMEKREKLHVETGKGEWLG
jgi:hypothetical protein